MPRTPRKDLNTNFFHVIMQGINKEYIYEKNLYKRKYQELLLFYLKKYEVDLLSYCVMSNHSHMLIHSENNEQMSKYMHDINTTYSKFYNDCENRVGVVFRGRYKSEPIYDYKYLYNCIAYIHNNPVKAKIVANPDQYKYSSYNNYINGTVNKKNLELIFGTNKDYIEIFKKIHKNAEIEDFEDFTEYVDYSEKIKSLLNRNISEIMVNQTELESVVRNLIIDYKVPISKVCEILKITRYKVSKILKSYN